MDSKPNGIAKAIIRILCDVDRQIYSILVFEIGCDPVISLQILAFWIWLEQTGFSVMQTFLSLPRNLISGLAEDALTCIECISFTQFLLSPAAREILLTQRVLGNRFSLQYVHEYRDQARCGMGKIFTDIYAKAMTDFMAMPPERNTEQQSQEETMLPPPQTELDLIEQFGQLGLGGGQSSHAGPQQNEVPLQDRTMVVTFSRGFPVADWEINEFITRAFGNCIESMQMQSLYAHVVFSSPETINSFLHGAQVAKFSVNGKDIWMSKFVPPDV